MAIKNYWTRIVPPGFNKAHMIAQNLSAVQGGNTLQTFFYLPTGGDKLEKCKQIFDFNFVNDQYYQPLQVEEDGTNRVTLYKQVASSTTNNIGGTQSPVIRIDSADMETPPAQTIEADGTIMPQFDFLCDKNDFATGTIGTEYIPNFPGKTGRFIVKTKPISPYSNNLFLTTESVSGNDGQTYRVVAGAPVSLEPKEYPAAGITNIYKSNSDSSERRITTVYDGMAGPYSLWSSVYNGNPTYPPDRMKKDTTGNIYPFSLLNKVYIKSSDISGSNQWQGAWQIKKNGQGFSNVHDDPYYCDWFCDIDNDTYKDIGLVETRKFFGQRACSYLRVKEDASTSINSGSFADPFNGKRFYIVSPRLDYRETNVFGRRPICKKITADDIDEGSDMSFLIGKWIVWIGSQPAPIIVSEEPLEGGWELTPTEASYSKLSPNLKFTNTPGDGGAFAANRRHFINIIPTDPATLLGIQTDPSSGAESELISGGHICYGTGGSYYGRSFPAGQPEVNPDYDSETDPMEDMYLWNTPRQVKASANNTFTNSCAIGGAGTKIVFYNVTYKLFTGTYDESENPIYQYPTDVQVGWYKMVYNKSVGAFEPQGSINYINLPVVATSDTDDGLFGAYRLHKIELDPSYFGINGPMDNTEIRHFCRIKHPDVNIGWDIWSFSAGIGLNYCYFVNQGTLPWAYPIPPFKPENALKLEAFNEEDTSLNGYYRPEYKWDYQTYGDFKDFMMSNGESLGTLTFSGSISGGNYEYSLTDVRRYYYPDSPYVCDQTYDQTQAASQHLLQIIRVKDGMFFAGLPPYNDGNAFWRFDDFPFNGETGSPNFFQDPRNKNYYFETNWNSRKIFDQRADSDIIIVLSVQIPLILNLPRNNEFFYKRITLRKWKVELDGTTTEIYNIDNDGFEEA